MTFRLRLLVPLAAAAMLLAARAQPTEEVPFITSPDNVTLEMLRIAGVRAGDHVIDLGSGDGRIVILAAQRFGATGLGVEIVPELVQRSRRHARDAGVADKVEFREQDLFRTDLAPASVVTMYLLPEVNLALRPSLLALAPGTRVVSHDWDLGEWKPDQTSVLPVPDKQVGLDKTSKVHLWVVPARVEGVWCVPGPLGPGRLELRQSFQQVQGRIQRRGRDVQGTGRLHGSLLQFESEDGAWTAEVAGDTLRLMQPVPGAVPQRMRPGPLVFARAKNHGC